MDRRCFISNTVRAAMLGAAFGALPLRASTADAILKEKLSAFGISNGKFKTKFAPNIYGLFFKDSYKGLDEGQQIDFLASLGFIAFEDNNFFRRSPDKQELISNALKRNNMEFGVATAFGGNKYAMTLNMPNGAKQPDKAAAMEQILEAIESACKTAKKHGLKWLTVVPGLRDDKVAEYDTFVNVVSHLKEAAKICEKYGTIMVIEPLNNINHPGQWLKTTPQAYAVCKAVGSPACKILFDVYHQQTQEGNLLRNIGEHFDEIAYFHLGDVPNRTEPFSGEINYKNVIEFIKGKGYTGIFGMEHRTSLPGIDGDKKLLSVYRELDMI